MKFDSHGETFRVDLEAAVIGGFTGRDTRSVEAHLDELAEAGVPVPPSVPTFYAVPGHLLTQGETITVTHDQTSGEAEAVLVMGDFDRLVTLGSDHTDRAAETVDIALAKLACPKVVARAAWRMEDVAGHWDELRVRSWISEDGGRTLYQEGTLGDLLPPEDLLERIPFKERPRSWAMFTGTLPARGGIRPSSRFWAELHDPVRERSITLSYEVRELRLLSSEG